MAAFALALFVFYLALAFGARTAMQPRRTGSTGFRGVSGRPGSAEWLGGVLFVAALGLGLAAPVLGLVGAVEPVGILDGRAGHTLGFVLYALGLAGTLAYRQEGLGMRSFSENFLVAPRAEVRGTALRRS